MKRTRHALPVVVAAFAALALAGCGSTPSGPTVPMGPPPSSSTAASDAPGESADEAESALDGLEGTWCPTEDSEGDAACFTVEGPDFTVDGGPEWLETSDAGDGTFTLSLTDESGPLAPYGVFAPAGIPAGISEFYEITDLPDEDRIFNGQIGVLYVRS